MKPPTESQRAALDALAESQQGGYRSGTFGGLVVPVEGEKHAKGNRIASVYVNGNTVAAMEARGWIARDDTRTQYGSEQSIRRPLSVGGPKETFTYRPILREWWTITDEGRAVLATPEAP